MVPSWGPLSSIFSTVKNRLSVEDSLIVIIANTTRKQKYTFFDHKNPEEPSMTLSPVSSSLRVIQVTNASHASHDGKL